MQRFHFALLFVLAFFFATCSMHAQEVHGQPGQFDYYVMNLAWSPAFCDTLNTLSAEEKQHAGKEMACSQPHAFVLHGLWTQNFDGTYPSHCSDRPGPRDLKRYLDITPNIALLRHEWEKHGTCTTLSPDAFFGTARQAYDSVSIPEFFKSLDHEARMTPDQILTMFYKENPTFPQGSFNLSCGKNDLTAVSVCFDKDMHPIACVKLRGCNANSVRIVPENAGGIVQ